MENSTTTPKAQAFLVEYDAEQVHGKFRKRYNVGIKVGDRVISARFLLRGRLTKASVQKSVSAIQADIDKGLYNGYIEHKLKQ